MVNENTVKSDALQNQESAENSGFDVRMIIDILWVYKYWFIASVILCMFGAWIYLRYSTPIYSVYSKVLIKEKDNKMRSTKNNPMLELGMTNFSNGFENEVEILHTKTMSSRVVKKLKLYTSYYVDGKIKDREIYSKYSPYLVDMKESDNDSLHYLVEVELNVRENIVDATVKIDTFPDITQTLTTLPSLIPTPVGNIYIEKNNGLSAKASKNSKKEYKLTCYIYPADAVAHKYAAALSVEPLSKLTTIASLTLLDALPERSVDYLTQLVEEYNADANADNNIEATRTAEFIDERLGEISKELNMSESEIEHFKSNNGIVDYQKDAELNANQNKNYEAKLFELTSQINLLTYLNDYVNNDKNYLQPIPSDVGLNDKTLLDMIKGYNERVLERMRLLRTASETSPVIESSTREAEAYFTAIKSSLRSASHQYTVRLQDLKKEHNKYSSLISSSPAKERILEDIKRQQVVKADLYIMLLQKREENLITLASSAYKAKVIEDPVVEGPVAPRRKIVLLIALLLGFAIPFGYVYLRNFFNFRIEGKDDLARLCRVPLLGTVPFVKSLLKTKRQIVLQENRNSIMMEVYRGLRSNLPFVMKEGEKVILFTSSSSGEGKTFIAANLATSMAFAGKKVVIIGLDIRKPKLAEIFDLDADGHYGISDFMARQSDDMLFLDKIIMKSGVSENLDVIMAGTIPPNPSELLERDNLPCAIEYLKTKYDYIVLDTAPVGIVADTLSVARCADLCLYVVRADYTLKSDMELVNSLAEGNRLPNLNIVLNGVDTQKKSYAYKRYGHYGYVYGSKGRGYGYSYGYGYGYGSSKGYGYGYGPNANEKLDEI